jgi:GcrA cell cycle regulator
MQEYVGQRVWTESEDDQLKEMWGQGLPASTIAEALGKTKNSVIGRRSRLGIPQRENPIKPKAQPPKVTRICDLEKGDCRWPDGDEIYDFCGKPVKKGSVYCESHHKRAYKKIDKKPGHV